VNATTLILDIENISFKSLLLILYGWRKHADCCNRDPLPLIQSKH